MKSTSTIVIGACGSILVFFFLVSPDFSAFAAKCVLGPLVVLFAFFLIGITLFKDPTLPLQTAVIHHVLICLMDVLRRYYDWRERQWATHVKDVQDEVLLSVISTNGNTSYGQKYGLLGVKTRKDFVKAHPLTKFNHYTLYVQRMVAGEKNVLTREEPVYYGLTSGTTGTPSVIPFVKSMRKVGAPYTAMYTGLSRSFLPTSRYQRKMNLYYNPTRLLTRSPTGIIMGPISVYYQTTSRVQRDVCTTPLVGFEIADTSAAQYVHLLFGLRYRELTSIEALFASLVYFAFREMEQSWQQMVDDIRHGSLSLHVNIPNEMRAELTRKLTAMPERAAELEAEFSAGFDNIAKRIWPRLSVITTITSGSFRQYAAVLREKFTKDVPIYTPYYVSTEGFFGYNHWPDQQSDDVHFLLAVKAMFFEFLPVENADDVDPQTVYAEQVEVRKEYEMVLTNFGGLYRYRIGDIVRIVGFYQQIPIMQYVHRSSQQLNIRAEKVSEDTLLQAIVHLNALFVARHGFSRIVDYSACESVMMEGKMAPVLSGPHYVMFLELQEQVMKNIREQLENDLGSELDRYLMESQKEGCGYLYYRDKGGLGPAKVILVKPGGFQRLRQFMLDNSTTSPSQLKIPRVRVKLPLVEILHCASYAAAEPLSE